MEPRERPVSYAVLRELALFVWVTGSLVWVMFAAVLAVVVAVVGLLVLFADGDAGLEGPGVLLAPPDPLHEFLRACGEIALVALNLLASMLSLRAALRCQGKAR